MTFDPRAPNRLPGDPIGEFGGNGNRPPSPIDADRAPEYLGVGPTNAEVFELRAQVARARVVIQAMHAVLLEQAKLAASLPPDKSGKPGVSAATRVLSRLGPSLREWIPEQLTLPTGQIAPPTTAALNVLGDGVFARRRAFGALVKFERERLSLTQDQLATRACVGAGYVRTLEIGDAAIGGEAARRVAVALGSTLEQFTERAR